MHSNFLELPAALKISGNFGMWVSSPGLSLLPVLCLCQARGGSPARPEVLPCAAHVCGKAGNAVPVQMFYLHAPRNPPVPEASKDEL